MLLATLWQLDFRRRLRIRAHVALAGLISSATALAAPSAVMQPRISPTAPSEVVIDYPWHAPLAKKAAPAGVEVFAFPYQIAFDSRRDGVWTTSGDVRRWELTFRVPGARSVAAELTFNPVAGAALSVAGETLIRAKQRFVTAHTGQETIALVMTAPASGGDPHVAITGLSLSEPRPQAAKASDPNDWVNYDCYRTAANEPNARASVQILLDGQYPFSGTLINNRMGEGGAPTPILLTAEHCAGDADPEQLVQNVRVYWKDEFVCTGRTNSSAAPRILPTTARLATGTRCSRPPAGAMSWRLAPVTATCG